MRHRRGVRPVGRSRTARYAAAVSDTLPRARTVGLRNGRYRLLEWPGPTEHTVVFLHGLSGVAEVWGDTVAALGADRPRCIALDQRGHGHSPRTAGAYAAADYLDDLMALVDRLDGPVRLVGHSMGARVAIVAAARHGDAFDSVVVVDIGPEAWKANITHTRELFASMPESFPSRDAALELGRMSGRGEAWANRFIDWRLRAEADGTYTWLASTDALIETVTTQRARHYWREWEAIDRPALLVRGERSRELRPHVVDAMRRRNPNVRFVEIPDVGHNIPLGAPVELAVEISRFWNDLG